MNMNMNMKNEKTMLALIVVAALAMVSVAGVALASDQSDAATSETYSSSGTITIASDAEGNYYVYNYLNDAYLPDEANVTINVNSDASFTGYVYFCTAKTNAETGDITYDKIVNSVYFNAVSNITVLSTGSSDGETTDVSVIVSGSTTGTVTLEKGQVQIGVVGVDYAFCKFFTGTVTTVNASFKAVGIAGAIFDLSKKGSVTTTYVLGADASGIILGDLGSISPAFDLGLLEEYAEKLPTLSASGKFTINNASDGITAVTFCIFEVATDSTATVFYDNDTGESSEFQNDGVFVVNGTVVVKDTHTASPEFPDAIDNNGYMVVNGLVEYTTDDSIISTPIDEVGDFQLWASYYSVKNSTTITHYYTSLTSAMAASNEVTLYGFKLITADMSIDESLTLGEDALVVVGIPNLGIDIKALAESLIPVEYLDVINNILSYIGYDLSDLSESYPTVTVAAGGSFDTSVGDIYVINGKLSVDQDYDVFDDTGVHATVCGMAEGTNTIYTNLDTALSLVNSGDTIELSMIGYLFSDATIAEGVTVTSGTSGFEPGMVIVYCGTTLDVAGTLDLEELWILPEVKANGTYTYNGNEYTGSISLDAATVNINKNADVSVDYIMLGGVLNIASDFDNATSGTDDVLDINEINVFSYVREETDTEYNFEIDVDSAVLNINGKFSTDAEITASGDSYFNENDGKASLTVNVSGTLATDGSFADPDLKSTVNVTGKFIASGDAVAYVNVTGTGDVSGSIDITKLTSGVLNNSFNVNTNETTVKITGDIGIAVVYGTTASGAISIRDGSSTSASNTVYYLVAPDETEIKYVTMYTTGDTAKLVYYTPEITGYNFDSWMDEDGFVVLKSDIKDTVIGTDYDSLYANFSVKTTSVTLGVAQNGTWVINDVSYGSSGVVDVPYSSSYGIQVLPANGYELSSDFQVLVNGKAVPVGYVPSAGDFISFSGSINEKEEPAPGTDLVTILLVIITIVIVIMAIIIALKLMRS
jgi:hypothetical protein